MTKTESQSLNVVCLVTFFKGVDFIRELKRQGCRVVVVTKERMLLEDWPRDSIDELFAVPNDATTEIFIDLMRHISLQHKIDRVVALEEFDVVLAGLIREHLGLPGMSSSNANVFRDKFSMSLRAQAAGITVPDFVALINRDDIKDFMERVPPPWIVKPRSDASAIGIKKVETPDQVWNVIEDLNARERLNERANYYLLARFVPGEVFHVDSTVHNGKVVFAAANRYGRPPMQVAHGGGAYISHLLEHGSTQQRKLFDINKKLVKALGLQNGITHAEFIKSEADGNFYFLEIASRVGGAYIADVLEAASGINLWREWAKLVVAGENSAKPRGLEKPRKDYAGIVLSLAKQEAPDTSAYDDPEIVFRVKKKNHVGLIVRSDKLERVTELLDQYAQRFADDFIAIVPPLNRAEEAMN
ncbi:MAG TPA: ATP-grasp domain-containing protein [Pyrinomonadaceae bacterium]|nr:ATP-grasp domain-containing protein [Pyrinomonadaceae bacterium]